jgi:hypothetical protein
MWTYSPGPLSTWAVSQYLADILWPIDDSPANEPKEPGVLKQLDLTPKDLENESIRKMLESEWPQIVDRMLIVAWLRRPDVPFYQIYELCQHLTKFSEYLHLHEGDIIGHGRPYQPFVDSPWLDAGLSNLYPLESVIDQIRSEEYSRILRQEVLKTKIEVVDFLAKNLRIEDPGDVSKRAFDLARSRHSLDRIREFNELEETHLQEQFRHGCPKETTYPGGYADIVRLIAYCEKEVVLGTFDKAKSQLLGLSSEHHLSTYIQMSRSRKKKQLHEVIWMLQVSLDAETDFYREFSARTRTRLAVARLAKTFGAGQDYRFLFTGHEWLIRWNGGETYSFQNLKGLQYIAHLLRFPNKGVNISELYAHVNPRARQGLLQNRIGNGEKSAIDREDKSTRIDGSGVEKTDERTIIDIWKRIKTIERQLKSNRLTAQTTRDRSIERRKLLDYLSESSNYRGTSRLTGSRLQTLRTGVAGNVTYAREKLRPKLPELANHLKKYLHTGLTCTYSLPNDNIKWDL